MTGKAGLLLAAMMLLTPMATAETVSCDPPCGWIQPYLDLLVEDKLTCGSGLRLGDEDIDPEMCYDAPTDAKPIVIDAHVRLFWEMSEDGTYPHDPAEPIIIDFSNAGNAGKWLKGSVEPSSFTITSAELLDPNNLEIRDLESGSPSVWYVFDEEIIVTYSKEGAPSKADLEIIKNKGGYQPMFLRVHSGSSGSYFKESWALEEFRFFYDESSSGSGQNGNASESNDAPFAPFSLAILGLALLALRRRN
jgi:hypothetical protein